MRSRFRITHELYLNTVFFHVQIRPWWWPFYSTVNEPHRSLEAAEAHAKLGAHPVARDLGTLM